MAKKNNYLTYAASCEYEPQELILDGNQLADLCTKLSELGTRRILLMRPDSIATYKKAVEFTKKLEKSNFRLFPYSRRYDYASSQDIYKAYELYMEYNCDTIVVFGGEADIYCAKMVEAMAVNGVKDPTLFEGFNKIKKDISLLCCVGMDNSSAISSSIAEFKDENSGEWCTVLSSFLIPQIVYIDTDIAMRTFTTESITSALDSLGMAIEAALSPVCRFSPLYKATAMNSVNLVLSSLIDMKDHPDDEYFRRRIAIAGVYTGTAMRTTGLGYAHLAIHAIRAKTKTEYGKIYLKALISFLKIGKPYITEYLAELYNYLVENEVNTGIAGSDGLLDRVYSEEEAADAFIELIETLYATIIVDDPTLPSFSDKEYRIMADTIRSQAEVFGLNTLTSSAIEEALRAI